MMKNIYIGFLLVLFLLGQAFSNDFKLKESNVLGHIHIDTVFSNSINAIDFQFISKRDSSGTATRFEIYRGKMLSYQMKFPSQNEVSGFSVDWIRPVKNGFCFSIEFGTRDYFQKKFFFQYLKDDFYLIKIETSSFDKNNPEHIRSISEKPTKIGLNNFNIYNFIN